MSSNLPVPKRSPLTKNVDPEVKDLLREVFPQVLASLIESYSELEVEIRSISSCGHTWNVTCVSLLGTLIQRQLWYPPQSGRGLLAQHDIFDPISGGGYEYFSWYPEGQLKTYGSGDHWRKG